MYGVKKLLLAFFLCLVVFSQMYSLVVGVTTVFMMPSESVEDTDPEDVVTMDPVLPVRADLVDRVLTDISTPLAAEFLAFVAVFISLWFWSVAGARGHPLPPFSLPSPDRPLFLLRRRFLI